MRHTPSLVELLRTLEERDSAMAHHLAAFAASHGSACRALMQQSESPATSIFPPYLPAPLAFLGTLSGRSTTVPALPSA